MALILIQKNKQNYFELRIFQLHKAVRDLIRYKEINYN